jgi:hypothetical protein
VTEVLNGDYRLNRVELPDCWPVHPRAVRELAWLRTVHVASSAPSVRPDIVAEWHTRWLPAAIKNIAASIDPRECAPGRHRLTAAEQTRYEAIVDDAKRAEQVVPELTAERGPDRPRYLPNEFPPLRTDEGYNRYRDQSSHPDALDTGTPPPPSRRENWLPYFLDQRLFDAGDDQSQY